MLSNVARCAENMMTTTVVQAPRAMAEVMHRMDPLQLHRLHLAPPCTVLQRVTPTDTDVVDITTIVTDMVADMADLLPGNIMKEIKVTMADRVISLSERKEAFV